MASPAGTARLRTASGRILAAYGVIRFADYVCEKGRHAERRRRGPLPRPARDDSEGSNVDFARSLLRSFSVNTTCCERRQPVPTYDPRQYDSFPNLTRHGQHHALRGILTPQLWQSLCDKRTKLGVTVEDLVRGTITLPHGAFPTKGLAGVLAGDAESYQVFAAVLNPLIVAHHHQKHDAAPKQQEHPVRRRTSTLATPTLQRHQSNLNPGELLEQKLDPDGEYILYTRMRLARNIAGHRFCATMSRQERRQVQGLVQDCLHDFKTGAYVALSDMSNAQHQDLLHRNLCFADPDPFMLASGLGRDWPDGRGLYCDHWSLHEMPSIMIWCNAEDHVWIISNAKGGDVQGVFARLSTTTWALETSLHMRNYEFCEDERLGFLNSSPANLGTALRASVHVKLVRLGQHPEFVALVQALSLEARPEYASSEKRYTGIFDIANGQTLGRSEVQLINVMIKGVGALIELEKRLEQGHDIDLQPFLAQTQVGK